MAKMQLNAAQQEAVTYTQGPCLVLAGAGSGKTRVIITKIAYLLRNNLAQPAQILAVTFTNKAAAEMRERIALEVGPEISSQLTICTFHSLGRQILKEQAQLLRLGSHFSIFDETDTLKILKGIIASDYSTLKSTQSADYLSTVASHISRWKGELKNPSSILKDPKSDHITAELYQKYSDYLRACNAVDFDDLIYLPTRLLLLNEKVRSYYQQRYRYIMVDEYQDTNHTQYYLLMCLVASNQRFMVVGDDDQSIYSWRGARPENIKQLTVDFPELKVIKLEQNYRSTSRILHCANSIIAHNQHLFSKTLYSGIEGGEPIRVVTCNDNEQSCEYIAAEILGHRFDHRSKWGDYAILYRSNSQSRDMEKALMKLVEKYRLTALTVKCFDLLDSCRTTACLALARLNDDGIVSGCEGDIPALWTMMAVYARRGKVPFMANPSSSDRERLRVDFAHCTVPTSMTESFTLPTHFESGIGVGIAGILPTGRYSVVKIGGRRLDRFYGAEGTVTANTKIVQRCRTQVSFRFDSPEDFDRFFANRLGNHIVLVPAF